MVAAALDKQTRDMLKVFHNSNKSIWHYPNSVLNGILKAFI